MSPHQEKQWLTSPPDPTGKRLREFAERLRLAARRFDSYAEALGTYALSPEVTTPIRAAAQFELAQAELLVGPWEVE